MLVLENKLLLNGFTKKAQVTTIFSDNSVCVDPSSPLKNYKTASENNNYVDHSGNPFDKVIRDLTRGFLLFGGFLGSDHVYRKNVLERDTSRSIDVPEKSFTMIKKPEDTGFVLSRNSSSGITSVSPENQKATAELKKLVDTALLPHVEKGRAAEVEFSRIGENKGYYGALSNNEPVTPGVEAQPRKYTIILPEQGKVDPAIIAHELGHLKINDDSVNNAVSRFLRKLSGLSRRYSSYGLFGGIALTHPSIVQDKDTAAAAAAASTASISPLLAEEALASYRGYNLLRTAFPEYGRLYALRSFAGFPTYLMFASIPALHYGLHSYNESYKK